MRREHAPAAPRTATLKRLCRDLQSGGPPLVDRVRGLRLETVVLEPWEEVVDPGGGDTAAFVDCAREVVVLIDQLAAALRAD